MNIDELKEVLYKISVVFVRDNDTMIGSFNYGDLLSDLFSASYRRHIIDDLQLFETNLVVIDNKEFVEAIFQFSPNYLNREVEMLCAGMRDLKWKLVLPQAIDRVGNKELEDDKTGIAKEIIEKIASGFIEIIYYEEANPITKDAFVNSLITQAD